MNQLIHFYLDMTNGLRDSSGLHSVLKGFDGQEIWPGYWMLKTTQTPAEIERSISRFVIPDHYVILPTGVIQLDGGAVFPSKVRTFLGSQQNAA